LKIVSIVLGEEKKYKGIIRLSSEITSLVFTEKARRLFGKNPNPRKIKKHLEQLASFRKELIALGLCPEQEITSLSNLEVYNRIVRPISIKSLHREIKRH
jgi:hypothetical protein